MLTGSPDLHRPQDFVESPAIGEPGERILPAQRDEPQVEQSLTQRAEVVEARNVLEGIQSHQAQKHRPTEEEFICDHGGKRVVPQRDEPEMVEYRNPEAAGDSVVEWDALHRED